MDAGGAGGDLHNHEDEDEDFDNIDASGNSFSDGESMQSHYHSCRHNNQQFIRQHPINLAQMPIQMQLQHQVSHQVVSLIETDPLESKVITWVS